MLSKIKNKKIKIQNLTWPFIVMLLVFALESVRISSYDQNKEPSVDIKVDSKNNNFSLKKTSNNSNDPKKDNNKNTNINKVNVNKKSTFIESRKLTGNQISSAGESFPLRTYRTLIVPNDTYANQWWVSPTGMDLAWDNPAGSTQIITAVIDTGFAIDHQEFAGRWATNDGELGATTQENPSYLNCTDRSIPLNESCNNIDDNLDGIVDNESGFTTDENKSTLNCSDQSIALNKSCNNRDDDGNGFIDDYTGWDFVNFDRSPQAGETNPDGEGTYHGTLVSGVLGATGNNNVGISGVNWQTKILPIQALNDDGYGNSITVADSIYYAVDRGANIISVSLGTDYEDPYLREAIFYAQEAGAIVVAAAGNDGCDCLVYPANYPEVLAVGSFNAAGNVSSFSSYGSNLDIVAPGENMTGPYWTKNNQTSTYASGANGTSFATPFVSGALGLMKSYQPDASWDEIIGILMENSDRKTLTASSPRNNSYGFGFIKPSLALDRSINVFNPFMNYKFGGNILGTESIGDCQSPLIPGSYLFKLTKSSSIKYTINQYEIRKSVASGWKSTRLFGVCVGLPTDMPEAQRLIGLNQELFNTRSK